MDFAQNYQIIINTKSYFLDNPEPFFNENNGSATLCLYVHVRFILYFAPIMDIITLVWPSFHHNLL